MHHQLKLDPRIIERYPEYRVLIIYARGLSNKPSNEYSTQLLRQAESERRATFANEKPSTDPHIAAWRQAYQSFGAKPSKFLCSLEALLSRVLKGHGLPNINYLVDLYNVISLQHLLPVGGYMEKNLSRVKACQCDPDGKVRRTR